jgi:uncharacterized protein YciI
MQFVVIGMDKGTGEHRAKHRAAHLDYIADRQDPIIYAGPLIEDGRMIGSLFVFDLPDRAALDAHLAGDPYFTQQIFETVQVFESRWMVPEREPGFLRAEAAKAKAGAA